MSRKKLKKQLRLFDIFAISTGAMFSSGFFLLPGIAAAETGPSVYLAYLASGLLIVPAMLSVAELSTAMPKAGGAYYFLDRSLGPLVGTVGGLGSWIALMFKSAFALLGMGAYLALYIDVDFTLLALLLTLVFGFLNVFGAKETTFLQRLLVSTLIVIMAIFLIQGLSAVAGFKELQESDDYLDFFRNDLHGFVSTIGLVIVSYMGLTKVASVAEEVENPDRNIPLGMILSLATATTIYVIGVYIMLYVLEPGEFYMSLTPVADAGAKFMTWLPGGAGILAVVIAAVAAFASTGNAGIMSASRYPFAMARDHLVSPRFGKIGKTGTPVFSVSVTVACMILILLIFDVEAVAKLASAFQLLLFAILCLSVIVMRESKIAGYAPGFRSPLYPWTQIAGMLVSVWLIAEMGLLAVALTGVLIVFCIAWYYYYTNGNIRRQGAIFHVHERLGRKRYERLEHELLAILNEKNEVKSLAYEEVVARSVIDDLSGEDLPVTSLIERAGDILAGRTRHKKRRLVEELTERYQNRFTNLGNGVFVCYLHYEDVQSPEMVVFRTRPMKLYPAVSNDSAVAVIFLIIPGETAGLDMRLVGHLAEIVQPGNFRSRWMNAESERELRKILISDEHFLHLTLDESGNFNGFVGRKISDLQLPGECLVAIIHRAGDIIIPHGRTLIEAGDELAIIGNPEDIQALASIEKEPIIER